jgi:hypothetical protein
MASKYRIKVSAMRNTRDGGYYLVVDNIYMRTTPGGANINTITSGVASAYSVYQTNVASNALPGQANYYHSALTTQASMNAGNLWWEYDFNDNYIFITEYTIQSRNDVWWQYDTPTAWNLEWYSPLENQWVVIDSRTGVSWTQNELKTFTFSYSFYWKAYAGRNNLTVNSNYLFKTTSSGIEIYNSSYSGIGFISSGHVVFGYYFNAGHANDDYLYIGTNNSGIVRSPMSSIASGVYNNLSVYKQFPDILSNEVLDIHGNGDYICAITSSGVDEIKISTGDRYYTTVSGASRCFQTTSGIYYLVSGSLNAVYTLNSNWTTPDYFYNESTHPSLFNVNYMYDLHIKDGVIYLATNNGVIIIKEERGSEVSSDYKRFKEI